MSPLRIEPATLRSTSERLVHHLATDSSWLRSSGIPAPWYSGQEVELLRDLKAVAVAVIWLAPDHQPELNSSK